MQTPIGRPNPFVSVRTTHVPLRKIIRRLFLEVFIRSTKTTKKSDPYLPVEVPDIRTFRPLLARMSPLTHDKRKEALVHVVVEVLEMIPDEDGELFEAFQISQITTIDRLVACDRQDVFDLVVSDGDDGFKKLSDGFTNVILMFLGFVQWRKGENKPIEDQDWMSLTAEEFESWFNSPNCRQLSTPAPAEKSQPSPTSTARKTVSDRRKRIKREPHKLGMSSRTTKSQKNHSGRNVTTQQTKAQHVGNVSEGGEDESTSVRTNLDYSSTTFDEELEEAQKKEAEAEAEEEAALVNEEEAAMENTAARALSVAAVLTLIEDCEREFSEVVCEFESLCFDAAASDKTLAQNMDPKKGELLSTLSLLYADHATFPDLHAATVAITAAYARDLAITLEEFFDLVESHKIFDPGG